MRHDRVRPVPEQIADVDGAIGAPYKAESMLERLHRRGDIDGRELQAGLEFQRLWCLGWLEPLRAASMDERILSGRSHLPFGNERAHREARAALDALGDSLARDCAWYVLGVELSLRDFAHRQRINEHVAKGVLLSTLGVLVRHFGM
jgi:hypothetical protein